MKRVCAFIGIAALTATLAAAQEGVQITSDTFGGILARPIGPAIMSGRIAAIDAVAADPLTIYVGAASGGVWKSIDAGNTFKPVFDEHTQSIGAVRVDPSNPKTVWVGTGESWTRNSVSVGTGIYKTIDGGDTWTQMGLKDSERIARIAVDPKASDTVYACVTGRLWSPSEERGVYKTTDGGKTWERVLHVDSDTGCSDLALDPQEPSVLYAGMWQFRRYPDFFKSGGKGSGLYKSSDAGKTWKRVAAGLPKGELGRIAVAVAPSRPSTVYAVVEAKKTALYRSDDTGESFREVNFSFNIGVRPFYFAYVVVDPTDHNTVYKPGLVTTVSTDGGKTFSSPFTSSHGFGVHSDHHALWIDPRNPSHMLLGTDGGLYFSYDKAHHWTFAKNLPLSQFYHVSADNERPYNVYGGLQDNSSWVGPSRSVGGIENRDWDCIGNGDGFWAFADPNDSDILYTEWQGGELSRIKRSTGEIKLIKPYAATGEKELRFNWNTPIHLSPNDPGTIYFGSQFLHRSRDRGDTWERISPDLTTNDPKRQRQEQSGGVTIDNSTAENNTTIYTISESPKNQDVIWVGTDDGHLQVTRDGGKTWTNVVKNVAGVPAGTWVSRVEASPHEEGTAFATFDGHRAGDMATYVFKTTDHGATWTALAKPSVEGYAWVVKQDPVNPNLLLLGTEFGLYLSLDSGQQWARFKGDLPKVAVHDLVIQPREGDLVIATHGRGIYIIDDLTPIRALTQQTLGSDVVLLPSRPSERTIEANVGGWFAGDEEFIGRNPPEAAAITYWLKKRHLMGDLKVEVYDAQGKLISTIPGTKRVGINRVVWPMRLPQPKLPPSTNLVPPAPGPRLPEGAYAIKLIKGKETLEGKVELVADPRSDHSAEDRAAQQKTALELYGDLERLTWVAESAAAAQKHAEEQAARLAKGNGLRARLERLASTLDAFGKSLAASSEAGWLSGEQKLREKLGTLYFAINAYEGKPTAAQTERLAILERELAGAEARWQALQSKEVAAANDALLAQKLEPIPTPSLEEWRKKSESGATGTTSVAFSEESAEQFLKLYPDFARPLRLR